MNINEITTYQSAMFQAKAYRRLKVMTTSILKKHDLTMMQWSLLGFINDAGKEGVRITELSEQLDTTQAFITNTVNTLQAKGMVTRTKNEDDTRAKQVVLVPKYRKFVQKVETSIRNEMRLQIYSKITREELITYIQVLEKLSK